MRTLNIRLLAILLASTALVGAAAYGVHELQVRRNARVLIREADAARDAGRDRDEIEFLQRYLSLEGQPDADVFARLGLRLADRKKLPQAANHLERALRLDPERDDVRKQLLLIALAPDRRNIVDARAHLQILLTRSPDDFELQEAQATCELLDQKYDAAAALLEQLVERQPDKLEVYLRLAAIRQARLKQPAEADAALDQMVASNPDDPKAYIYRGLFLLDRPVTGTGAVPDGTGTPAGDAAPPGGVDPAMGTVSPPAKSAGDAATTDGVRKALDDARRALELAPDDAEVLQFAVRAHLAARLLDDAAQLAARGLELFPDRAWFYSQSANVELRRGQAQEALHWLDRGIAALPEDQNLRWSRFNLQLDLGETLDEIEADQSRDGLSSQLSDYPAPLISYLEARILINRRNWHGASQALSRIRASLTRWPDISRQADYWLGRSYEALGQYDLEEAAFLRALQTDPNWLPAHVGLAQALASSGKDEPALRQYEIALRLGSTPQLELQYVRLAMLVNFRRKAADRSWPRLLELLARMEQANPAEPQIPILRAEILVAQHKEQEARQTLEQARDRHPRNAAIPIALAAVAQRTNDFDRALEILDQASSLLGESAELRVARGRVLIARDAEEARPALRALAEPPASFDDDERLQLQSGMAGLAMAAGDLELAEQLCQSVADQQTTNLRVRLLLFDLARMTGRTALMERILGEIAALEGTERGPLWRYGEAVRLVVSAQKKEIKQPAQRPERDALLREAREHLVEARRERPNWSRVAALLGNVEEQLGEDRAAADSLVAAIELGERGLEVVYPALQLLGQQQRNEEAARVLRTLESSQTPFSVVLDQLATQVSLRMNDTVGAATYVQRVAAEAEKSGNPTQLIWVGATLRSLGQNAEAEQKFREAIARDESAPDGWLALVRLLHSTGQTAQAEEALTEMNRKVKSDGALVALALAQESLGRLDEAEQSFLSARKQSPDDLSVARAFCEFLLRSKKPAETAPHLRQIIDQTDDVELRTWARRNLSFALLAGDQPDKHAQALKLIEQNQKSAPDSPADLRVEAMILVAAPDPRSRERAIPILEKLLSLESAEVADTSNEERIVLAQLYTGKGDFAKAREQYRKLAAADEKLPQYPAYLGAYIQFLIARKEIPEAETWLAQMERVAPGQIETVALALEVPFAAGRWSELPTVIERYLAYGSPIDKERADRRRLAAGLLEGFGQRLKRAAQREADAEKSEWAERLLQQSLALIAQYAQDVPDRALVLAAFLNRQGKPDEGVRALEQSWEMAAPAEIAAVSATLLSAAGVTLDHYARAAQVMESALARHDRPASLLLALADLECWRGRNTQSEALYRETLKAEPRNPAALNNLALLLALQGARGTESLELIEQAIQSGGADPSLLDSRGAIRLALGEPQVAFEDIESALARRPSSTLQFHKAQVLWRLKRIEEARQALAKAQEMGLRPEFLHPMERPGLERLTAELQ